MELVGKMESIIMKYYVENDKYDGIRNHYNNDAIDNNFSRSVMVKRTERNKKKRNMKLIISQKGRRYKKSDSKLKIQVKINLNRGYSFVLIHIKI